MSLSIFRKLDLLSGVSARLGGNLKRLLGNDRIIDLLLHAPVNIISRLKLTDLTSAQRGDFVTLSVKILEHIPPLKKSYPYKVVCSTASCDLKLIFFNGNKHYLRSLLPIGATKVVSGRVSGFATIAHPDYIVSNLSEIKAFEPLYPLTYGLNNKLLVKLIGMALVMLTDFPEWINPNILIKNKWESFRNAIFSMHRSKNISLVERSKNRLACDEFLVYQLQLQRMRDVRNNQLGQTIGGDGRFRRKLLANLPFELTCGQERAIRDILEDQFKASRMFRLLQGDVGSGKTVVALFAILNAIECKKKAVLMVPTEILALQHANWIKSVISEEIRVHLLIGRTNISERRVIESFLDQDVGQIVVGTHTLFQDSFQVKNLGLVVIDEQHRFGVKQREKLLEKGSFADLLLMSATPIPRTLSLALYGDIDCSILQEKPVNRIPIKTAIISRDRVKAVIERMKLSLAQGAKIYWICPLVKESDNLDFAAVVNRFEDLFSFFGDKVGLVHGKMKLKEREKVILQFKKGEIAVLVSTTVVEVGIDVTDANIMIIENAERFGLSQLHQLRGRVGRGKKESFCVLLCGNVSPVTQKRLRVIRDSNDGFYIAEQDLTTRGSGELVGYRQSGMPNFKFFDFQNSKSLPLNYIHNFAKEVIKSDSNLEKHQHFRDLISIFNQENSFLG